MKILKINFNGFFKNFLDDEMFQQKFDDLGGKFFHETYLTLEWKQLRV